MINIATVIGFSLICAFLISYLKQHNATFAVGISVSAACVLLLYGVIGIRNIADSFFGVFSALPAQGIQTLVKAVGITVLCGLTEDICAEAGHKAIAGQVRMCEKAAVILCALPLLEDMLAIVQDLI